MFPSAMEKKDKQLWNFIRKQNARKIDNYICERNYNICIHRISLMNLGAVVAVIVWNLNLQMPMESVPITTNIVGSTPAQGKMHNIMWQQIIIFVKGTTIYAFIIDLNTIL
jgi:site-specific recombinase